MQVPRELHRQGCIEQYSQAEWRPEQIVRRQVAKLDPANDVVAPVTMRFKEREPDPRSTTDYWGVEFRDEHWCPAGRVGHGRVQGRSDWVKFAFGRGVEPREQPLKKPVHAIGRIPLCFS